VVVVPAGGEPARREPEQLAELARQVGLIGEPERRRDVGRALTVEQADPGGVDAAGRCSSNMDGGSTRWSSTLIMIRSSARMCSSPPGRQTVLNRDSTE
jgi:hypothetical protein